jgi:hypothetical protein
VRPSWPADEYEVALESALEPALEGALPLVGMCAFSIDQSNPLIFFSFYFFFFSFTAALFYFLFFIRERPARAEN